LVLIHTLGGPVIYRRSGVTPDRPRRPRLGAACFLLVLVLGGSLLGFLPAAAAPKPGPPTIAALKAEVARTADRLDQATIAWQQGQLELGALVQRKMLSKRSAEQLEKDVVVAQAQVSSLAASLYRNPVDPMLTAFMTGNPNAIADMIVLRRTMGQTNTARQDAISMLNDHARDAQALVERQDRAATAAIRLQTQLDGDLEELRADALASLKRLESLVAQIRRQAAERAARAAAARGLAAAQQARLAAFGALGGGGASCSGEVPGDAINGILPDSALCPLTTAQGHRLIAPATAAFDNMSKAFAAAFDKPICVTDSYRTYAAQVRLFATKPNLAATPGRSQHGWGRAVDLCGGIQNFGTPPHRWLKDNAAQFGFIHPDWAEPDGSRPEPWHWEFRG